MLPWKGARKVELRDCMRLLYLSFFDDQSFFICYFCNFFFIPRCSRVCLVPGFVDAPQKVRISSVNSFYLQISRICFVTLDESWFRPWITHGHQTILETRRSCVWNEFTGEIFWDTFNRVTFTVKNGINFWVLLKNWPLNLRRWPLNTDLTVFL